MLTALSLDLVLSQLGRRQPSSCHTVRCTDVRVEAAAGAKILAPNTRELLPGSSDRWLMA